MSECVNLPIAESCTEKEEYILPEHASFRIKKSTLRPHPVLAMGLKEIPYEEEMVHLSRLDTRTLICSKATALVGHSRETANKSLQSLMASSNQLHPPGHIG